MKTLTIMRDTIDLLGSDESKLEFANSVISLFTDSESTDSTTNYRLQNGLNVDIPEPLDGAPLFDSKNMAASQFKRFSMVRAGYVPATLDCGYEDYSYLKLKDMSDNELIKYLKYVELKILHSKGKREHLKFLNYIRLSSKIYCINADRDSCL